MFAAQLAMLLHVKVIPSHFAIDFGLMLQYNSLLEFKDENQEDYYINNYDNLTELDITNISSFRGYSFILKLCFYYYKVLQKLVILIVAVFLYF